MYDLEIERCKYIDKKTVVVFSSPFLSIEGCRCGIKRIVLQLLFYIYLMTQQISVFWFRRDLRLDDNAGFYQALLSGHKVLPVFIFDTNILDSLSNRQDASCCVILVRTNNE